MRCTILGDQKIINGVRDVGGAEKRWCSSRVISEVCGMDKWGVKMCD